MMSSDKYRNPPGFASFVKFAVFSLTTLLLTIAIFALWFDHNYSSELRLTLNDKPPVVTILADNGHVLAKRGIRDTDIALEKLPQFLIDAVISTEDRRFYSHHGLDPQGLMRAIWNNISTGRRRQGGSTITQQLVKNVFLTRRRTLTRKMRELVISFWLEAHFSKQQILETYLNRVYFGAGASHGIEAAAQLYFDKSATDLDLAQSAMLAGLLKAPSYYSPRKNLRRARLRADIVLENMIANGVLTASQAQQAFNHPASLKKPRHTKREIIGTEYALDWIMERLQHHVGRIETDLVVKTTLNFDWQIKSGQLLARAVESARQEKNIDQAAAVVMDKSGGVKLMIGGTSYAKSQFNRVTMARRQPGSSFKPVVYLAAMESGSYPGSIEIDQRLKIEGWRPRNYARVHRGPVTLRKALASSINTVAAKLADDVGLDQVIATARRLGIRSKLYRRPSLALGSSEVTPLEMTGAYVPFMNGGHAAPPHIISEVATPRGELVYEFATNEARRVIGREFIYDMNDMLGAVVRTGTGKRAQLEGHATAGKTGTTQDYRDAWFIGYTGHFTGGVWAGNDDNSPTNKVSGGRLPALLWKQIMQIAHKGRSPLPLPGLGSGNNTPAGAMIVDQQLPVENIIVDMPDTGLAVSVAPAPELLPGELISDEKMTDEPVIRQQARDQTVSALAQSDSDR